MRVHAPETQTLYAQLFESTAAHEHELVGSFRNGLAIEREVRGHAYLYWQMRDVRGRLRQVYLGAAHDERARALRDALVARKEPSILADLERITAAYVASGGARHQGAHFAVVDALARAGLFRAGAVLVGSHAFVSLGAALGVSWDAATIATADVDLSRDAFVTVACDVLDPIHLPGVLGAVAPSFFIVPAFDVKAQGTSLKSRTVKVDLLTTARHPRDTKPREIGPFGIAAQPLRYMDYLVREDVQRGLFIGPHAVLINMPHAGRFALHKLAVATRRAGGDANIKATKDRLQAAALIEVLANDQPGALAHAVRAARAHHDKGLMRDARAALTRLPDTTRAKVKL